MRNRLAFALIILCCADGILSHASSTAFAQEGKPNDPLPTLLRWEKSYPVYGINNDPNNVLRQPIAIATRDDGDKYLLGLARAADINLLAWVPSTGTLPVPQSQPEINGQLHMRFAEVDRDCALVWHRASERTILLWPRPDEEKMGRTWSELYAQQQQEGRTYASAATPENILIALKSLKLKETEETKRQLLADYIAYEQEQAVRRLSAILSQGWQEKLGYIKEGQSLAWRDLSDEMRVGVVEMLHLDLQSSWINRAALWFFPEQRKAFWRNARLRVHLNPGGEQRDVYLYGEEQGQPLKLFISAYDVRNVPPGKNQVSLVAPPPRPTKGITIEGERMPLRQVLEKAGQQSGLAIGEPLPRLNDACLTLSVRGMSSKEFLQALARTFLIQWQVQGKTVTMQETPYAEADRYFLRLGDTGQYRILTRRARDDWREETELARLLKEEAGEALFAPEGVPIAQMSEQAQAGVQREGQEIALDGLLRLANDFVPAALEEATLEVNRVEGPRTFTAGLSPRLPANNSSGGEIPTQGNDPVGLSVALKRTGVQTYLLAGLQDPTIPVPTRPPASTSVVRIITAYKLAQGKRDERIRRWRDEARQRLQQNRPPNRAPEKAPDA